MTPNANTMLWKPSKEFSEQSNLKHYMRWLREKKNIAFDDYQQLWEWSVNNINDFWESIWQYFEILHDGNYQQVSSDDKMPHVSWFEGTQLNYAEHVFRKANDQYPAILFKSESSDIQEFS